MKERVRREGNLFVDASGRQVILRGVNLGGDSKVPYPDGGTQFPTDFANHRTVSFVGRPFPLAEADEHFARLKYWGFNVIRLLTTWEAVEHGGPGCYDEVYLDYLQAICARAGEFGLHLFVDFHQDVWSRMTGGDGAPGWCFEAVGLDFTKFHEADCAHIMQRKFDYSDPSGRQAAYPQMTWGSNYRLPATGIMWSLFWGGNVLTPDFKIDGHNVQDFLQGHYLSAMDQVARRVADLPNVLGFDTLNEPGIGYLGEPMSYRHMGPSEHNLAYARAGACLSPADALAVARGIATPVPVLARNGIASAIEVVGERCLNSAGISIWLDGAECPFERAGAYRLEDGALHVLRDDYFRSPAGFSFDISEHAFSPLAHKVAATIRRHNPEWAIFAEMDPYGVSAGRRFGSSMPENAINANHWYDRSILMEKTFDRDGQLAADPQRRAAVAGRFARELAERVALAEDLPGGAPTLIGEFGIPFDLEEGEAYAAWDAGARGEDIWRKHTAALSLMYDAMDTLQLHSTQWNYTAANGNDLRVGDNWNQEDLSIFSEDQRDGETGPGAGGRAVRGFCRPFARAVQGRLARVAFDADGKFDVAYLADPAIEAPTVLFVPEIQYPGSFDVSIEGAARVMPTNADPQLVEIEAMAAGPVRIVITRKLSGS